MNLPTTVVNIYLEYFLAYTFLVTDLLSSRILPKQHVTGGHLPI